MDGVAGSGAGRGGGRDVSTWCGGRDQTCPLSTEGTGEGGGGEGGRAAYVEDGAADLVIEAVLERAVVDLRSPAPRPLRIKRLRRVRNKRRYGLNGCGG